MSDAPGRSAPGKPANISRENPLATDYVHPTEAQKYRVDVNDKVFPRNPVYHGMSQNVALC